jgi:hypothetical protein
MPTPLDHPAGRRVETMIVARREVDDGKEHLVPRLWHTTQCPGSAGCLDLFCDSGLVHDGLATGVVDRSIIIHGLTRLGVLSSLKMMVVANQVIE